MPSAFVCRTIPFVDADTAEVIEPSVVKVIRDYIKPGEDTFPEVEVHELEPDNKYNHEEPEGAFIHYFVAEDRGGSRRLVHKIYHQQPSGQKRRVWFKSYP